MMDLGARLWLVVILGLRRQDGRGLVGVLLLQVRLRPGRRRQRAWSRTLRRGLVGALEVWVLAVRLLVLRRVFHH